MTQPDHKGLREFQGRPRLTVAVDTNQQSASFPTQVVHPRRAGTGVPAERVRGTDCQSAGTRSSLMASSNGCSSGIRVACVRGGVASCPNHLVRLLEPQSETRDACVPRGTKLSLEGNSAPLPECCGRIKRRLISRRSAGPTSAQQNDGFAASTSRQPASLSPAYRRCCVALIEGDAV